MGRDFYGEFDEKVLKKAEPYVPEFIKNNTEIHTATLPNGNTVTEPVAVTSWISQLRKKLTGQKEYVEAEIATQKSAARNEVESVKQYWRENVLNDKKEIEDHFVTASVLSLGGWFFGSVISSRRNWGFSSPWNSEQAGILKRTPTVFSKLITSLPVRLTLPWILAGAAYQQLTPNTWNNALAAIKNDFLPKELVEQSAALYDSAIENGLKAQMKSLNKATNEGLESSIGAIREAIAERTQ